MKWICPVHPHIVLFDDDLPAAASEERQYCSQCKTYYYKRECDEMIVS